jgi:hypothetical protein
LALIDLELPQWRIYCVMRGADGSRECAPDDRLRDEAITLGHTKTGLLRNHGSIFTPAF